MLAGVADSLRDALARSYGRVLDIFLKWDDDGDGSIDKKGACTRGKVRPAPPLDGSRIEACAPESRVLAEFRSALRHCGFDAPVAAMNELFDELDVCARH